MAMLATRNLRAKIPNYIKILAAINLSTVVSPSCGQVVVRHNLLENIPYQITIARNYAKGRDKKKDKGLLVHYEFHHILPVEFFRQNQSHGK